MKRLREVADLVSGQHVLASYVNADGRGVEYLTGPSDFDGEYPAATTWTEHGTAFAEPGDLLVTVKGSGCGTLAIADKRYAISRQLMAVRPRSTPTRFLWAALSRVVEQLNAAAAGTIPGLNRDQILSIELPDLGPDLERQVADLDGLYSELMFTARQVLETKRAFKRALLYELLTGVRRFPGFASSGHRTMKFGVLVEKARDQWSDTGDSKPLLCVDLEHIESETGRIKRAPSVNRVTGTRTRFRAGDVLLGKLRPYLRKFAVAECDGACSTEIWVLRANPSHVLPAFLYWLVQSEPIQAAMTVTSGSKMPRADWSTVAEAEVSIPSLAEQRRISAVLQAADHEIALLERLCDAYEAQKRALLHRLLSGDLPLPAPPAAPALAHA